MVLKSAIPSVFVTDYAVGMAYYIDVLGFTALFEYGRPPFYAWVKRDAAVLAIRHVDSYPIDHAVGEDLLSAFIEVTEVDALFAEMQSAGAAMHQAPRDEPWGGRSFIVRDPSGNLVQFATNP
jgi:uncharacterized glyoxalase superfamily protein PhnB